jgi:high frequency lysogenization protein
MFQAARLAQQLARTGRAEPAAFYASVQSILMLDAGTTEEIFGGVQGVTLGLEILRDKLVGQGEPADLEIAKYVVALLHLEAQLRKRPDMQQAIRRGIETAESQMKFFDTEEDAGVHPNLVEKLAEVYSLTLSTLAPRIMVSGEQGHLANPATAAKVRAALLAGIRSAFLWHQVGGSRWQLLFSRKKLAHEARRLLEELRK